MTESEKIEFLKSIGMKKRRLIEGNERDHMLTLLNLIDPVEKSNNQRTFSELYIHAGKEYELTWGFSTDGPEPLLEEITDYDI